MLKYTAVLLLFFIGAQPAAYAQFIPNPELSDTSFTDMVQEVITSNIKFTGELGSQSELYGVSGRAAQRPGRTGRVYFRPTLSLFDKISFSLDLFLSTEGKGSTFNKNIPRPDLNTLGISPEWSWGKLYFGDFTMQMSQFTLTDAKISGYGVDLFPGIFKLMAYAGKSQKALAADAANSLYERTIYGGKIGLGDIGGDHIHLNFLRAYDNPKSLDRNIFRKVDSAVAPGGGVTYDTSYTGISPKENLILGVNWSLGLFKNKFRTKNEVAMSVYTADLYSGSIESSDIPKPVYKYYTPRTTTSGDFAVQNENTINFGAVNIKSGYTLVGPGYTSLGMGSLMNDKQVISGGANITMFSGNLVLFTNIQKQNDNTANQRAFTTRRDNYMVMATTRLSEKISFTLLTNSNTMQNDAKNDTMKLDVNALGFTLSTNIVMNMFKAEHTLDISYNSQGFESRNAVRGDNKIASGSYTISMNTKYTEQLASTIATTYNNVQTTLAQKEATAKTTSVAGSVTYKLFKEKWNNTLSFSSVTSDGGNSGVLQFSSSYKIFESSTITLQSRATSFKGKGANPFTYKENITNLDWVFRF